MATQRGLGRHHTSKMDYSQYIIHALLLITVLAFLARRRYQYWTKKGLKGPTPVFPIGYYWQKLKVCPKKLELDWFREYGRIYGVFMGIKPVLTISDADLVKQVLVKDFHLFVNRRDLASYHHIWAKNLFNIPDTDWKRIRSITSPAFSTGKLRKMYPHIEDAIKKLGVCLNNKTTTNNNIFSVKDTMMGFALDVIASTSFGLDADSNNDKVATNPFNVYGQKFFLTNNASLVATATFPRWMLRILNLPHQFPKDAFNFFETVSRKVLQNKGRSQTLLSLLQEANVSEESIADNDYSKLTATGEHQANEAEADTKEKKSNRKSLSENEIIAQCILFFLAGFETTSSALSVALFELSKNPETQERLYEEVKTLFDEYSNSDLNTFYDKIMSEMPYLEAVIKETLRKYPTVFRLERRVAADNYKLGGVEIERDTLVEISAVAVHYDPEYYPDPHRFNPDRFLPENKHLLVPYTYLPFGDGPRNCVGMRFALQEIRFCLTHMINNFKFEVCDETPEDLSYYIAAPLLIAQPFKLRIIPRN